MLRYNHTGHMYNDYPSTMGSKIIAPLYKGLGNAIALASYFAIHCITEMMTLKHYYRGQLVEIYTPLFIVISVSE